MNTEYSYEPGIYCDAFGDNARNRILEHFLTMRHTEFTVKDVEEETRLPRTTTYTVMAQLLYENVLISTRKIGNGQLYRLNMENNRVKTLLKTLFSLMNESTETYTTHNPLLKTN